MWYIYSKGQHKGMFIFHLIRRVVNMKRVLAADWCCCLYCLDAG